MKSSTSGLGLREIGNNSYAKCFGGWTWRFTDYLEVAERKQTLPLRNSGRVRRSKRCWNWTFNPLPLHTRMKNFPIRFLQIKIQKNYPSQQGFKRKKKMERVVFVYEPSVNSHCTTVSEKRCSSDTIGQQYLWWGILVNVCFPLLFHVFQTVKR